MVTEIQKSKLAELLSNIKSKDGKNNLLDHINKMYIIKNQLNNDDLFNDLFEDISFRIKKIKSLLPHLQHPQSQMWTKPQKNY